MALPRTTTTQDVLRAMSIIDAHRADYEGENPQANDTRDWRRTSKFAVVNEGRQYPVKSVVAMATGMDHDEFSGGPEANGFLMRLGFQVIVLKTGLAYTGRAKS